MTPSLPDHAIPRGRIEDATYPGPGLVDHIACEAREIPGNPAGRPAWGRTCPSCLGRIRSACRRGYRGDVQEAATAANVIVPKRLANRGFAREGNDDLTDNLVVRCVAHEALPQPVVAHGRA